MPQHKLQYGHFGRTEDWLGNNAAFTCPVEKCGQVFLVSALIHKNGRDCPKCKTSKAFITGSQSKSGAAWIEWPSD